MRYGDFRRQWEDLQDVQDLPPSYNWRQMEDEIADGSNYVGRNLITNRPDNGDPASVQQILEDATPPQTRLSREAGINDNSPFTSTPDYDADVIPTFEDRGAFKTYPVDTFPLPSDSPSESMTAPGPLEGGEEFYRRGGPVRRKKRRRRGYAMGGPVSPNGMYPGTPWTSPAPGNYASTGSEGSSDSGGGDNGGGTSLGGGVGYQRGGMVRRGPRRLLRRPARLLRRPVVEYRRRRPTGYAGGGAVDPVLMSVGLDSRSRNPAHYEEDREPLATRPGKGPKAPTFGYQGGGEVQDDDIQTLPAIEVSPDEEPPPDAEELGPSRRNASPTGTSDEITDTSAEDESDEGALAQEGQRLSDQFDEEQAAPAEKPAATGYNQPPADEEEPAAQPDQTGFNQQQPAPEQNALKEVLDYTRKTMGVEGPKPAETPAVEPPATAPAGQVTPVALPPPPPPGTTGETPDQSAETPAPQPQPPAAATEPVQPPLPTPRPAAAGQPPAEQPSGPGNKQALQDYVSGKGAFTADEMTQLLDRTNQTNPNLGQDGAIKQAFKNFVDKNDMEGASKFLQALRPSYDNVRALLIAATAKGDFATAMQLAERMNNLIPSGESVRFQQLPSGQILAVLRPDEGGTATQFMLTPEQFARYANSPLSLFDHTAEQGLNTNLAMLTGEAGQPRTQYAQAGAPAGVTAPTVMPGAIPGVGYGKYGSSAPLTQPPPAAPTAQPRTGYNAGAAPSQAGPGPGMVPETRDITVYKGSRPPEVTQVPTGRYIPGAPVQRQTHSSGLQDKSPSPIPGLTNGELLGIKQTAWDSFRGSDPKSRLARGNMEKALISQALRSKDQAANREQRGSKEEGINTRFQYDRELKVLLHNDKMANDAWKKLTELKDHARADLFKNFRAKLQANPKYKPDAAETDALQAAHSAIFGAPAAPPPPVTAPRFPSVQTAPRTAQPPAQTAPAPAQTAPAPAQTAPAPAQTAQPPAASRGATPSPGSPPLDTYRSTTTPPTGWKLSPGWQWGYSPDGQWKPYKPSQVQVPASQ